MKITKTTKFDKSNFSDLILGKTREEAIRMALKGFDTIILDDGFQDYRTKEY